MNQMAWLSTGEPSGNGASHGPLGDVRLMDAGPEDLAGLAAVHLATRRSAYADLLPHDVLESMSATGLEGWWRRRLVTAPQPHRTLVAVRHAVPRTVVGFAHMSASADGLGELFAIHVHPRAQGVGIGRRLMAAACGSLRDFGFDRARLWVLEGNITAHAFYERNGWQARPELRRHEDLDGASVAEIAYERRLPSPPRGH
jgi:ribosomal protein S18 acetylase RimI-like enzyme